MKDKCNLKNLKCLIILIISVTVVSCEKKDIPHPPQVLTDEVKSDLSAIADKVFTETSTPGLIALISVEGEHDFLIKRGNANIMTCEPIHENNTFRIASVTKTFTGTAVLLLADEGLIQLDNTINQYLPEYNIPSGDVITVRMLGNMTSGLFDYSQDQELWNLFIESGYSLYFPPESLLAIAFRHPLNFPPGTNYEYCNTNTVILGLLLEKITGKPASQVIKEKILIPLNLKDTHWGEPFFIKEPYTHGYTLDDQDWMDTTNWNPSWGYTAGEMISKIHDLKKWAFYLADGTLLSERMKSERFSFGKNDYGFCVESINYKDQHWVGHPGIMPGYNTQVWYNSAKKTTIIINSNTEVNLPAQTLLTEFIVLLGNSQQ